MSKKYMSRSWSSGSQNISCLGGFFRTDEEEGYQYLCCQHCFFLFLVRGSDVDHDLYDHSLYSFDGGKSGGAGDGSAAGSGGSAGGEPDLGGVRQIGRDPVHCNHSHHMVGGQGRDGLDARAQRGK